jgi:hypothetical protein
MRIALVATMADVLVLLFAVPLARRILALELPPFSVCAWVACVVLATIAGLTLWRLQSAADELSGNAARGVRGDGEADADAP